MRRVEVGSPVGRFGSWRARICGAVMMLAALFPAPSFAQAGSAELQAELEQLFQQLLASPADPVINARFVEVALRLEDYEAAIGALERLLFYNPDDASLNLRIGNLYLQLEAYVVAQTYFETVLASQTAPNELREQASAGIAAGQEGLEGSPISGFAQAGIRYQTNATAAPGQLDGVDPEFLAQPDFNSFVFVSLNYNEPVSERVILEAEIAAYYADQFEVDRLDLAFGSLEAGPRFILASGESGTLSFRPYGIANGILLGDDPYQRALGGGASARAVLGQAATVEPYFEYRDREFFNSDDFPDATDETGELLTYAVQAYGSFSANASWTLQGGLNQNDARSEPDSYEEIFVDASLRLQFDPDEAEDSGVWAITPFGGANWTEYAAAEPGDMGVRRDDFRWRTGATLEVPFTANFGLGVQVQYTVNESNLDRFDYDNLQVTSGPTARF